MLFAFPKRMANRLADLDTEAMGVQALVASNPPAHCSHFFVKSFIFTTSILEAVMAQAFIVTEAWFDKFVQVASTKHLASGPAVPTALELDWDANWPDPSAYFPPPGRVEEEERPFMNPAAWTPNSKRQFTFANCLIVVFEEWLVIPFFHPSIGALNPDQKLTFRFNNPPDPMVFHRQAGRWLPCLS